MKYTFHRPEEWGEGAGFTIFSSCNNREGSGGGAFYLNFRELVVIRCKDVI